MLYSTDIKAELMRRDYQLQMIAKELGVHPSTVTRAVSGECANDLAKAVLAHIATVIGIPAERLHPGPRPSNYQQLTPENPRPAMSDCEKVSQGKRGEEAA